MRLGFHGIHTGTSERSELAGELGEAQKAAAQDNVILVLKA